MAEPTYRHILDEVTADLTEEELMANLSLGGDRLECLDRDGPARRMAEKFLESTQGEGFKAHLDHCLHTPIGEIVREKKPIQNCTECGKRDDCMLCSRCKSAHYCSKQCQQIHWPAHKRICNKTVPKKAIHENKILVLGSRAMYIPVIQQTLFYLVFRKLQLDHDSWPTSPADSVIRLTWDLVPVCSPQEFYARGCVAPSKRRDSDDADALRVSMIQLVAVNFVSRCVLAKSICGTLANSVRYAAMQIPPGPKDLVVDILLFAPPHIQGATPKLHDNYYLYTPAMRGYFSALGEARAHAGSPFVKPRFDVTGLTSEEIMIRTINEAIVLDTSNEWRLRTHPRENLDG